MVFPKARGLGWGSVGLFDPCFTAVNASGREEGGAAEPGEGGSFPSPGFSVGWSNVIPKCCEHSPFISMGHYLERPVFSIYMQYSFKAFLLQSLWMRVSRKHHVNDKTVNAAALTMWPDCPFAGSLLLKCLITTSCAHLSVWPHMAKSADTSCERWPEGNDVTWCGFRDVGVVFGKVCCLRCFFCAVHISQNNWILKI